MTNNDVRETYIKELATKHKRGELDEIAVALGLNPADYSKKRKLAEAILATREQKEVAAEEEVSRPIPTEEVLEEEEKHMSSVRGKIKAAEEKADEFKAFYAGQFQQGIKAFQNALQIFKQSIKEQTKKNDDFIKNVFNQNVKTFRQSIENFKQSIMEQTKENRKFIKQFYG
jgi:hypothetical protein